MEFDDTSSISVWGPKVWGAIFMCNRKTKKECIRRNLFGLPSCWGEFVRGIRRDMTLFLFEYEERKLSGVFRATSNGALNIVPNAFESSGKKFSAQVLVRKIWNCHPLEEDEFRGAIRGNYYTATKFKFGLTKEQVNSLLRLFDSRKITIPKRPCSASSRNSAADFRCHAMERPRLIRSQHFSSQPEQHPVHEMVLSPSRLYLPFKGIPSGNDEAYTENEDFPYPRVPHINTVSHPGKTEDFTSYSSERQPVLVRNRALPPFQDSDTFPIDNGFEVVPEYAHVSGHNCHIDAPAQSNWSTNPLGIVNIVSSDHLPVDIFGGSDVHKGLRCNQKLSHNFFPSPDADIGDKWIFKDQYHQGVFEPNVPFAAVCPLKSAIGFQKQGIDPAGIVSNLALQFPPESLQVKGCSSSLQHCDHDDMNLPETESDGCTQVLSSSPCLYQLDDQCRHFSKYTNGGNDGEWDTRHRTRVINCLPNYSKTVVKDQNHKAKKVVKKKKNVFSRLSKAPEFGERNLYEDASGKKTMTWVSKRSQECILAQNPKLSASLVHEKQKRRTFVLEKQVCCSTPVVETHTIPQTQPAQISCLGANEVGCNEMLDAIEVIANRQFINFKRRSVASRDNACGNMPISIVEGADSTSSKGKRRKLVRPSFNNIVTGNSDIIQNSHIIGNGQVKHPVVSGESSAEPGNVPNENYNCHDDVKIAVTEATEKPDIKTPTVGLQMVGLKNINQRQTDLVEAQVVGGIPISHDVAAKHSLNVVGLGDSGGMDKHTEVCEKSFNNDQSMPSDHANFKNSENVIMLSENDCSKIHETSENHNDNRDCKGFTTELFLHADETGKHAILPISDHYSQPLAENLRNKGCGILATHIAECANPKLVSRVMPSHFFACAELKESISAGESKILMFDFIGPEAQGHQQATKEGTPSIDAWDNSVAIICHNSPEVQPGVGEDICSKPYRDADGSDFGYDAPSGVSVTRDENADARKQEKEGAFAMMDENGDVPTLEQEVACIELANSSREAVIVSFDVTCLDIADVGLCANEDLCNKSRRDADGSGITYDAPTSGSSENSDVKEGEGGLGCAEIANSGREAEIVSSDVICHDFADVCLSLAEELCNKSRRDAHGLDIIYGASTPGASAMMDENADVRKGEKEAASAMMDESSDVKKGERISMYLNSKQQQRGCNSWF